MFNQFSVQNFCESRSEVQQKSSSFTKVNILEQRQISIDKYCQCQYQACKYSKITLCGSENGTNSQRSSQSEDQEILFWKEKRQSREYLRNNQFADQVSKQLQSGLKGFYNSLIENQVTDQQPHSKGIQIPKNMDKFFLQIFKFKLKKVPKNRVISVKSSYSLKQKTEQNQSVLITKDKLQKHMLDSQIHNGIECDCCGQSPIKGLRFHCNDNQCSDDYDLCKNCFDADNHQHEMHQVTNKKLEKCTTSVIKNLFQNSHREQLH